MKTKIFKCDFFPFNAANNDLKVCTFLRFSEKIAQCSILSRRISCVSLSIIFTSRNEDAGKILSQLQFHQVSAAGLFGKNKGRDSGSSPITNVQRKEALESFRKGKVEVLICTDLAGRGLDIQGITHVVALDVPDSEVYIHRSGRTGRAGKRGIKITIGDEVQMHLLASLEKKLGIKIFPKELYKGNICVPEMSTD